MKAHGKSSQNFFAGLILVSDGSIKINNMTNRWVMAKKIGGEILVSGLAAKYQIRQMQLITSQRIWYISCNTICGSYWGTYKQY